MIFFSVKRGLLMSEGGGTLIGWILYIEWVTPLIIPFINNILNCYSTENSGKLVQYLLCARDKTKLRQGQIDTTRLPREPELPIQSDDVPIFTEEERIQLEDQMRKVAILCIQSFHNYTFKGLTSNERPL